MMYLIMWPIIHLWTTMCTQYSVGECLEVSRDLHRLPENAHPTSYELTLWMPRSWNNFTYSGQVSINISVTRQTNSIILNVNGLGIHEDCTQLLDDQNQFVVISSQVYDTEKQFYIIAVTQTLEPGDYSMSLTFKGEIRDDVFGFYRSTYAVNGDEKWIAVTQFSPTFARRAFPCFDEPYLKATFKLRIGHYDNYTVTSNTQIEKTDIIDGTNYILTTMEETPIMSTYVFGWAVHDFGYQHSSNSIDFGMWLRQSMIRNGSLALNEGRIIYSTLGLWMDMENPIRKLEHIAVPDFNFHAMENWGMITFRESVVLVETDVAPTKSIQDGLSIMAHEYSHTWFGNLVTPQHWDVAWLKEGFATYFSYFIRSIVYPHNRVMNMFVVENLQDVFQDDAADHNRTMNGRGSGVADEVLGFLDFSAYNKGAAIVRMVQNIMGQESFKLALRSYLVDRSYSFVTPSILYTHLRNYSAISGKFGLNIDIGEVIETYANEPGFPVITIVRNYSSNVIEISQERFHLNQNANRKRESTWWIPLNLASKSQRNSNMSKFGSIWMSPKDRKIEINANFESVDWVIGDDEKVGYYRINYDMINWNLLITHLNSRRFTGLGRIIRATLTDDAFNLARAGYIDYKIPFKLGNYLVHETEYEPWLSAVKSFNFLIQILGDLPSLLNSLQRYIERVLEPIYSSLSFNEITDDPFHVKLLRNLILTTACRIKNGNCLAIATDIFQDWVATSLQKVKPNLKSIVYCEGIRLGTSEEWEKSFRRFLDTDSHTEKELLMKGLGCSTNATLIRKFLDFSITNNSSKLPKQYRFAIIHDILDGSPVNTVHFLDYISQTVKKIIRVRGHDFLNKIFDVIPNKITSEEKLRKLSSLVDDNYHHFGHSLKFAKNAVTDAKRTIAWIQKYSPILANILE